MADDLERLIVQLSADFKSYENAMARASGITRKQLSQIKADASGAGAVAEAGFRRIGTAARASQGNVIAFRTGMQQLGFQAQDVAVQLAAGTSAMRVFGQQAPQILSIFGPAGAALGVVAAALPLLAAGLLSGGDAAAAFVVQAADLDEALKQLAASGYDVTAATDLFGASLQRLAAVGARASIQDVRDEVRDLAADFTAAAEQSELFAGSDNPLFNREIPQRLKELNDALTDLANSTDQDFAAAANRVLGIITEIGTETGNVTPEMQAVADAVQRAAQAASTLADNTAGAVGQAQNLAQQWAAVQTGMYAAQRAQQAINNSRPASFGGTAPAGAGDFPLNGIPGGGIDLVNSQFPVSLPLVGPAVSTGGGGSRGGGGGGVSAAVTQQLRDQQRLQEQLRESIHRLAEDDLRDLQRANRETAETFADLFTDAVTGARSLEDSLRGLAEQLAKMVVQRGFEQILNSIPLGGGTGGILGGIFGGARAGGGPVSAGKAYLVGERGPELFVPKAGGAIVPNGGGGAVTVQVINAPAGTRVEESRRADGGRLFVVMIKQAVDGLMSDGSFDRSMAANFGVRRRAD